MKPHHAQSRKLRKLAEACLDYLCSIGFFSRDKSDVKKILALLGTPVTISLDDDDQPVVTELTEKIGVRTEYLYDAHGRLCEVRNIFDDAELPDDPKRS